MMENQKCKMGHDKHMHFLALESRPDKAAAFKVNKQYTFKVETMKALTDCYGDKLKTMKIGVSCYSGFRSRMFQNGMVQAGFTCGNIFNVGPGAQGLWRYDNSTFVKGADSKGKWSCPATTTVSSSCPTNRNFTCPVSNSPTTQPANVSANSPT